MYFLLFKKALFSAIRSISMNAIFSTTHQKQTDQRKALSLVSEMLLSTDFSLTFIAAPSQSPL